MGSMTLISLTTLAAALVLTVIVRALATRWGVVDRPDGRRKLHGRAVPLLGGVAVYGATVIGLLIVRFNGGATPEFIDLSTAWIIAAGFVCFVGSIDDRFDLPSRVKLLLQIVSVLPIVALGHYVDRVVAFSHPIELGWLGIPLTVLWLVGCINALNLIDGMDGLASIVGVSTAAMMGMIATTEGHPHVAVMAIVLAASLLGFLTYNLPPASVFLGDSGSMVIGLSVGLLGIQGTLKTSATLAITAPAVVMTLPMFDILAALVRRKLTGRRFDSPDRLHIHHRLLDRGWTPWQVLCLIGAVCLTTGAAATAATIFRLDVLAWITAMSLIVLMIRLRLFGYEEFALVKQAVVRLLRSGLRRLLPFSRKLGLSRYGFDFLDSALTPGDDPVVQGNMNPGLWDILLRNLQTWDIHEVEFRSFRENRLRRIRWIDPNASESEKRCWSLSVLLPDNIGELCELRVAGAKAVTEEDEFAALTTLLKTFGTHFAAHGELLFGPPAVEPTIERHRKAA